MGEIGPGCPDGPLEDRVDAVCTFLADCAIAECAYQGDACRAEVYDGCIELGEGPIAGALTAIACAHTRCDQIIQLAAGQSPDLANACREGAQPIICDDGMGGQPGPPEMRTTQEACQAFMECAGECGNQGCVDACTEAHPDGVVVYNTAIECAQANNCIDNIENRIDERCLERFCAEETEACFGPEPMDGGEMPGAGPDCPENGDVRERLAAACSWLADCAISDCAYEGEVCWADMFEGCNAVGEPDPDGRIPPLATALANILCGHTMCAQSLAIATAQNEALRDACMEGAPPEDCR